MQNEKIQIQKIDVIESMLNWKHGAFSKTLSIYTTLFSSNILFLQ